MVNFVRGNTVTSGTGDWNVATDSSVSVSVYDPGTDGIFWHDQPNGVLSASNVAALPVMHIVIDMKTLGPTTIHFIGDASSLKPNPIDSFGFTAKADIDVINDTRSTLHGVTLNLANDDPQLPYNLVPGILEFGDTVNANYAFFTAIQSVNGKTTTLFSPDGKSTVTTHAAPSKIALSGDIAPGATVTTHATIHNTELTTPFNNHFSLVVSPV